MQIWWTMISTRAERTAITDWNIGLRASRFLCRTSHKLFQNDNHIWTWILFALKHIFDNCTRHKQTLTSTAKQQNNTNAKETEQTVVCDIRVQFDSIQIICKKSKRIKKNQIEKLKCGVGKLKTVYKRKCKLKTK